MKIAKQNFKVRGTLNRSDDYDVIDNEELKTMIVSRIDLKAGKKSFSHTHNENEEVYYFHTGKGTMTDGDEVEDVGPGDIVICDGTNEHYVTAIDNMFFTMIYCNRKK